MAAILAALCLTTMAQGKPDAATPLTKTVKPASATALRPTTRRAKAKKAKKAEPEVVAVVAPPPPPKVYPKAPVELPANPPVVRLQSGMLSVEAINANLSDVLQQIRQLTGATIEGFNNLTGERVVASIAPAPPRQVLMALLDGSKIDYVLLSPKDNPQGLQKIVLFRRAQEPSMGGAPQYGGMQHRNDAAPTPEDNSGVDEEAADAAAEAAGQDPNQRSPQQMYDQIQRSHGSQPNGAPDGPGGQPQQ